ncbi:MspA family porin [Rhodococcus ruber]|uniref:MspA family porin n=1 Tax=Rhodococcus ruber TaxID=1830 RepID=UPI00265E0490|nr:MspA family porin [Rhodococcus ruber]MDO1480630.1 mspA family protein [Rhodococcus ruber]
MSNKHTSGLRRGARIGGVAAAAAVALGFLSAGAANADTFVPLPDGEIAAPGVAAKITRTGESALVSPSLAGTGAGRVAWVSGTVKAEIGDLKLPTEVGKTDGSTSSLNGTNNSSTHGVSRINTGYIVGCQVDISGLRGNLGINFSLGGSQTTTGNLVTDAVTGITNVVTNSVNPSASLSVPLQPGQVRFVHIEGKDITKPNTTYTIQYQDAELSQQGCGGYAQARSYTVLEIVGNDYVKTTLYGQPFSIG